MVQSSAIEPKCLACLPNPDANQKLYINSKRVVQSTRLNQLGKTKIQVFMSRYLSFRGRYIESL